MKSSTADFPESIGNLSVEFLLCSRQDEVLHLEGNSFKVGTGAKCEIRFDAEKDSSVAPHHCTIFLENGRWYLEKVADQPVWLNEKEIDGRVPLPNNCMIFLGKIMGPGIRVFGQAEHAVSRQTVAQLLQRAGKEGRMVSAASEKVADELAREREHVKKALFRLEARAKKRFYWLLATAVAFTLIAIFLVSYQTQQLREMKKVAEDIFYAMKELEVQIAQLEELGIDVGDRRERLGELRSSYTRYLGELQPLQSSFSYEDQLILRMARTFGECELNIPPGFNEMVKEYIRKWQSSPRLATSIRRSMEAGYAPYIVKEMLDDNLPPQFYYVALQESDFDTLRVGPRTRFGIAKGMWQFMPETALQYGLRIGPLAQVRKPDPRDERHNFVKSTRAAADYLHYIYSNIAQASGLLVLASYNYGDTRVRQILAGLDENPRQRNFWNVMSNYNLPRQTKDYVFYIFSAAVIGEDPLYFGFDFENPIAAAIEAIEAQQDETSG